MREACRGQRQGGGDCVLGRQGRRGRGGGGREARVCSRVAASQGGRGSRATEQQCALRCRREQTLCQCQLRQPFSPRTRSFLMVLGSSMGVCAVSDPSAMPAGLYDTLFAQVSQRNPIREEGPSKISVRLLEVEDFVQARNFLWQLCIIKSFTDERIKQCDYKNEVQTVFSKAENILKKTVQRGQFPAYTFQTLMVEQGVASPASGKTTTFGSHTMTLQKARLRFPKVRETQPSQRVSFIRVYGSPVVHEASGEPGSAEQSGRTGFPASWESR